jgi:hypothetical protein
MGRANFVLEMAPAGQTFDVFGVVAITHMTAFLDTMDRVSP